MENNDQTNYELEVLKEELDRVNKIIEKYMKDNEELLRRPNFDPNDPQNRFLKRAIILYFCLIK